MTDIQQTITQGEAVDEAMRMRDERVADAAKIMFAANETPHPLVMLIEYVADLAACNELILRLQCLHEPEAEGAKPDGVPYM
jgi:hypothetical protein